MSAFIKLQGKIMDHSTQLQPTRLRYAGYGYLIHMILMLYGVVFVSAKIGISGTDVMSGNILAEEFIFRTGIISRIASLIPTLFLAVILYQIFSPINVFYARLASVTMLISIPFQFIAEVFNITALMIAKGELLSSMSPLPRHEFSILFLNVYNHTVSIGQVFWGLWLLPFGVLIQRSKLLPKAIGYLAIIGGSGYLIDYVAFLTNPDLRSVTVGALVLGLLVEVIIMLGLIFYPPKPIVERDTALR